MSTSLINNIITKKGENVFQVRLLKEDGAGLLTTQTDENYLILDSLDYWYDLIQNEYPKKKKCSCKNEWFTIQFEYIPREGTTDFREINIITTCSNCGKTTTAMTIDIDYSPTEELFTTPLHYCERPNIKYKYSELTGFWSGNDLKAVLSFFFHDLGLTAWCWYFKTADNRRYFDKVTYDRAIEIITAGHRYLNFYFTRNNINTDDVKKLEDEQGIYIQQGIWRRNEIIQLSAPYSMSGAGLLYYIHYCNQWLDKGEVKDKSETFEADTKKMKAWLAAKFISKRGKDCFDGEAAYKKFKNN